MEQSCRITECSSDRNSFGAKKEEKNKPALFEHLMRGQTAKSALSPVDTPHSLILHYSSVFARARLSCPASRVSGC